MKKLSYLMFLAAMLCVCSSLQAGEEDLAAGALIYVQCTGCHAPNYQRTGPSHCGIVGRYAGTEPGFEYTAAMRESGIVWTVEQLDIFLTNPFQALPGTAMGFAGIKSPKERRQLIEYLASLTPENPLCK